MGITIVWLLFLGTGPSMSYLPAAVPINFKTESACQSAGQQIKKAGDKIGGRTTLSCIRVEVQG